MSGDRARAYRMGRALRTGLLLTCVAAALGAFIGFGVVFAVTGVASQLAHKALVLSPVVYAGVGAAVFAVLGLLGTVAAVSSAVKPPANERPELRDFEYIVFDREAVHGDS